MPPPSKMELRSAMNRKITVLRRLTLHLFQMFENSLRAGITAQVWLNSRVFTYSPYKT